MKRFRAFPSFSHVAWMAVPGMLIVFTIVTGFQRENKDPASLRRTWKAFANAVLLQDAETLKALSTSCIHCSGCLTNTNEEYQHIENFKSKYRETWSDSVYGNWSYVPVRKFISEDITVIMDSTARLSLLNDSLYSFVYNNNHNAKLYDRSCITGVDPAVESEFSEVIVNVPGKGPEGFAMAFAFIKTREGYKFCGYSTIP